MSINIESRLARFNDLIPSKVPFVEGKLKGHQDRLNYSLVGPGVSEDSKQNVKIAEEHGFNIGAVSAAPMNGSGLHSHTTAEVFIIFLVRGVFIGDQMEKRVKLFYIKEMLLHFPLICLEDFKMLVINKH